MTVKVLHSGSAGNSTLISSGETTILIDAGLSYKKINLYNGSTVIPDAVFITHEHTDHILGAGIVGRATKAPIYIPELSYNKKKDIFKDCTVNFISGGDTIVVKDLSVLVFSAKHDSEACVGFVVTDLNNNKKLGFLTDTGIVTPIIRSVLKGCDAYYLECNYDTEGLEKCAVYTDEHKERISSPIGHLGNEQALAYISKDVDFTKTSWIILGHLSQNTNSPEILKTRYEAVIPNQYWDKIHIGNVQLTLDL